MNDSSQAPDGEKKGLHPLVWTGIGCGALLILIACAAIVFGMFFARKATNFLEEARNNPAKAAELLLKFNPDLEVISTDDDTKSITVRDKGTGKTATLRLEDIAKGHISFEADGESINIQADQQSNTFKVTDGQGNALMSAGKLELDQIPAWVRDLLPEDFAAAGTSFSSANKEGSMGSLTVELPTRLQSFSLALKSKLEAQGFTITDTWTTGNDQQPIVTIQGTKEGSSDSFSAVLTPAGENKTNAVFTYQGPAKE